jgi:hypothetical protein
VLRCAGAPAGSALVSVGGDGGAAALAPCAPAAPAGEVCVTLPSAASAAAPAAVPLLLAPLPPPAPPAAALSCTVFSTPLLPPDGQPPDPGSLPRYGAATTVALPLAAPPAPAAALLLAAVWAESRAVAGAFRVVGGEGAGVALPPLPPPALPARAANATAAPAAPPALAASGANATAPAPADDAPASWSDPAVGSTPGALAPLYAAVRAVSGGGGGGGGAAAAAPPSLYATLSGATHLLLLLSDASAPFSAAANVSLNGVPCGVNYVSADGRLASVTTPPLSALCGAEALRRGDCGGATLLLFSGASPVVAAVGALGSGAPPPLPAAYPPLLPPLGGPLSALPALGALAGLELPQLLALAPSLAPAGAGLRLATACTDPLFAAPEFCALVRGGAPPPPPNGTACAWGAGDGCAPCPPDRALCPGGEVLLPLPGYWAPAANSPPGELLACPAPDAALRCPGWAAPGRCGAGFAGQACSGCAPGFFPSRGSCARCPALSAALAQALPLLQFFGALGAVGVLLLCGAQAALSRNKRAPPPCCGPLGAAPAVGNLLLWTWVTAQCAAALFSQTLAAGAVPPALDGAFSAFAALNFVGVTLAPECYSSIPFQPFWACFALAAGAAGAAGGALLALRRGGRGCGARGGAAARALLLLASLVITVGFSAYVSAAVGVVTCRLPAPLMVADYVRTAGDGGALGALEAIGGGRALPPLAALRRAADDPWFAAQTGVTALLRARIPVALLAADPYVVCGEGAHARARPAAVLLLAALMLGLPGAVLAALWQTGGLKGFRRVVRGGGGCRRHRAAAASADAAAPAPAAAAAAPTLRVAALLVALLVDPALRESAAWFTAFQWVLTSLCAGAVALTARAAAPAAYFALQGAVAAVMLGAAALVLRVRPFTHRERWRGPVLAALYGLAGAAAACNLVLRAVPAAPLAFAACSLLIAAAAATFALLLWGWWHALVVDGAGAVSGAPAGALRTANPLHPAADGGAAAGAKGAATVAGKGSGDAGEDDRGIMASEVAWAVAPGDEWVDLVDDDGGGACVGHAVTGELRWHRPGEEPWHREFCGGGGGFFYWRCEATGAAAACDEELPAGARTADGWALQRSGEDAWWWHANSGEAVWEGPWLREEAAVVAAEAATVAAAAAAAVAAAEEAAAAAAAAEEEKEVDLRAAAAVAAAEEAAAAAAAAEEEKEVELRAAAAVAVQEAAQLSSRALAAAEEKALRRAARREARAAAATAAREAAAAEEEAEARAESARAAAAALSASAAAARERAEARRRATELAGVRPHVRLLVAALAASPLNR